MQQQEICPSIFNSKARNIDPEDKGKQCRVLGKIEVVQHKREVPQEIRGEQRPSLSPISASQSVPSSCDRKVAIGLRCHPFLPHCIKTTSIPARAGYDLKKKKCLQEVTCHCLYINIGCQREENQNIT